MRAHRRRTVPSFGAPGSAAAPPLMRAVLPCEGRGRSVGGAFRAPPSSPPALARRILRRPPRFSETPSMTVPRLAVVLGDPAGLGPEIAPWLLAEAPSREGGGAAGGRSRGGGGGHARRRCALRPAPAGGPGAAAPGRVALWDSRGCAAAPPERWKATAKGGRYALDAPRGCLRLAGMGHPDEPHWSAKVLRHGGPTGDVNVRDGLWTCRVASHVALREVAPPITEERILTAARLIHDALRQAGMERSCIAVCGFNPHNGAFGREELDVIGPAAEAARRRGPPAEGPYPADTILPRAAQGRRIARGGRDRRQAPRPWADRGEADGVLARRHGGGWAAHPVHHLRPWHRLRHPRWGRGPHRRVAGGLRLGLRDGLAPPEGAPARVLAPAGLAA